MSASPTRSAEIVVTSRLGADPERVWDRVITPTGINDEMRPYLGMTIPAGVESLDPESIELGEKIGRSWVLLFGRPVIGWFFRHRHKRLRRYFGGETA